MQNFLPAKYAERFIDTYIKKHSILPTEYYSLSGFKVTTVAPGELPAELAPGIYITRRGNSISKVTIR